MGLIGIGAAPLWANTFDYLDKNLRHENFPMYSALVTLAGVVGPGVGYILGGYFLSLPFDDVTRSDKFYDNLTNSEYSTFIEDSNFIGAYWLGFVLSFGGLLLFVIPVLGFPFEFP